MTTPILRADSMGRRFGNRAVLTAATLCAYPGRITLVMGRNGCGKSTLLKLIVGSLRADYGAVHFNQHIYLRPRLHELARKGLFYIPERGLLSRYLTLEQNLSMSGVPLTEPGAQRILAQLSLDNLLNSFGTQLSGGERRLSDLALAMLKQPLCLLADEPFQGMAPIDGERIANALRTMRDQGAAIVVTGHEVNVLFDVADEVVWMTAGTTHLLGSVAQARDNHQFNREYLAGRVRLPLSGRPP
jgi:ABC-type multidrug transport system ATPase subunit